MNQMTFEDFVIHFDTEEACVKALYAVRWPNGFQCPHCHHQCAYVICTRKVPLFECKACKKQTSIISGTVMEGSRISLRQWFQAIYLHAQPNSVNATQLSLIIGVTYKTAWLICHKLRFAMDQTESSELLTGLVRVSEAIYAKRLVPHLNWHDQEQPLLIGSSEDESGAIIRIKIEKQAKETMQSRYAAFTVDRFIRRYVKPEAAADVTVTRRIGRNVNRTLIYVAQDAETWLARVFLGIGSKHLQAYLNQYCFMFNHDKNSMFGDLLRSCVNSPTITYPSLIGRGTVSNISHLPVAS